MVYVLPTRRTATDLLTGAGATVFVMAPECQRLTGMDPFAPEFVTAHADLVVDLLIRATTEESA